MRERVEELRQGDQRLVVHVARRPVLRERIRPAVAVSRIDDGLAVRGMGHAAREIPPHGDRAQPLVQEDERRPRRARDHDALVFDAVRRDRDERHSR